MDYILAIFIFSLPLIISSIYSNKEYSLSLSDNLENWTVGKYAGILVFILYASYILFSGYVGEYVSEFWFYCLEPSIFLSLIVFSKPASELLDGYASFVSVGINEDMGFIAGWLGLLYVVFVTSIESV